MEKAVKLGEKNTCNFPKLFYQANVGDSRAIASVRGKADPLSHDHKPGNEAETRRIIQAGGWVEFNRVNGRYTWRFFWVILMTDISLSS